METSSSYPPCRKILSNVRFIKRKGIREFIKNQEKRIDLLGTMIKDYDDGRSRSFFCRTAALLDPKVLKDSLNRARREIESGDSAAHDTAGRAKVLRRILKAAALSEEIDLKGKK